MRLLALLLLLAACTPAPTERGYQRLVNQWIGAHYDELLQAAGPPQDLAKLSNGGFVVVYRSNPKPVHVLYSGLIIPVNRDCETRFTVGADLIIEASSFSGRGCVAEEQREAQ